jgi:hypothetical protein
MNKRTGLMLFALIFLAGVLVSCTAQAAPAPTETPTAQPPTVTVLPSATARPTAIPTVTSTPLSSDAQALKDIVFSDCIPVEEGLPEGFEIPWDLLVIHGDCWAVHIYNPEDGSNITIPYFSETTPEGYNKFTYDFFISPDGKWLAYQTIGSSKLIIESTGTLLTNTDADRIVWDRENWFSIQRWVDNHTLLAKGQPPADDGFFPTIFLDPITREEHEFLLEEMPNYLAHHFGGAVILTHYLDGEVIPDPAMKYLIYPERWGEDGELYNILWDIEKETSLARTQFFFTSFNGPFWAQDSSDVLLVGPNLERRRYIHEEWFLINPNGVIRQITQFQDLFLDDYYYFSNSSRSWDDRYLAFQLTETTTRQDKVTRNVVLDLKSNLLQGFCIEEPVWRNSFRGPVWSPDNKYFVISNVENYRGEIIMVDVENEKAYKIGQDMRVIGWIAKLEGEQ